MVAGLGTQCGVSLVATASVSLFQMDSQVTSIQRENGVDCCSNEPTKLHVSTDLNSGSHLLLSLVPKTDQ